MAGMDAMMAALRGREASLRTLGYRVLFELTDSGEAILLDAAGGKAELREAAAGEEADCVLRLSSENLGKLVAGKLSPMLAFATGKLRVEGSKGVAMKLATLLDEE